ncbi:MAG: triacylglycerol lipase [Leptolyngbyaceae bacterium]|nr:triacylglycerol lipase [Leptolyngbyaceae bacterium]
MRSPNIDARNPVVLVHGLDDTPAKMAVMQRFLEAEGWTARAIALSPSNGEVGLENLAEQLSVFIDDHFEAQPVDLIGFSMGGIVSRYYVQRLGGIRRVQRLITLASPHSGTWIGYLRQNRGASQMRRSSAFLQDLNQDVAMLADLQFTSVWTPFDLMIVPAESSQLPIGDEITIPVWAHSLMVSDRRCLEAIAQQLQKPARNAKQAA